uniref:FXNA-like protease n=1 Tax=Lygus hesperus TaxID=30085 RepID=A0A146L905_LYGHE
MINIRRRRRSEGLLSHLGPLPSETDKDPMMPRMISHSTLITFLLLVILLYGLVQLSDFYLPDPLTVVDEKSNPGRFIAERAKYHVTQLSNLGPRPVGSLANEVLAIKYLSKTLSSIQAQAHKQFRVEIDHHVVSGEFPLQFLDGLTSVYRNIQNIVVKVGGKQSSGSAILLNCHYDSVVDSPGATDDLAACGVLLEVLRVITQTNVSLHNDLVFLFNGAEENLLQASHGFITQHKWAHNLLAVINMDACGAGGRELLFQVGPQNPWLLEAYAQAVKYPTASIAAQEIFQSGLIPGDTDYRIFRDFGRIPGLDFAWAMGGYMYHTKLDSADYVPLSSLQHTGDNILPLTLHLANVRCPQDCEPEGTMVFFDLLHLYLFRITSGHAYLINGLIVFLSLFIIYWKSSRSPFSGVKKRMYMYRVVEASLYLFVTWIITILIDVALAVGLYMLNRSLSWFTRPLWIYFLYGIPAMVIPLQLAVVSSSHFKKALEAKSNWAVLNLFVDGNQLLFTIPIVFGLVTNVQSMFLFSVAVGFHCIANLAKNIIFHKNLGGKWSLFYAVPMLFPCLLLWYISHVLFKTIIPIMGRAGSGLLPEVVIAVLTATLIMGIFNFLVPLMFMYQKSGSLVKHLAVIFICSVLVLIFTPLGFPYSASRTNPSPQRYAILHTHRVYYGVNGVLLSDLSGFWVVDLDPNSPYSVKSFVPEFASAIPVEDCPKQLYCGLPYKLPVSTMLSKTHWIPGPKPTIYIPSNLTLVDLTRESDNYIVMKIKAEGPDHMRIMISPIQGVKLVTWSFANGTILPGAKWGLRDTYFIYYSYASYPGPLYFWMKFKIIDPAMAQSPFIVDIAVSGHFLHGPHQKSVKLTKLLAQFPPWTVTSGWVATYTSYKF